MVIGLEMFKRHFADYTDSYILIGGSACDINLNALGGSFRTTKDLDIVLCVEARTNEFAREFWRFIREGGYSIAQRSSGDKQGRRLYYRFQKPRLADYPKMLELLARKPEWLELPADIHVTPIPLAYDISSLSAILLDDNYYQFILNHRTIIDGVSLITLPALIVLKAKAWMNLMEARSHGERILSGDIAKHKNDVARLTIFATNMPVMPDSIRTDMQTFLERYDNEIIDVKGLHLPESIGNIKAALHRLLG
ncbi:MAG: hypothetical protein IKX30_17365 [Victivallales bacterium]|nr:hypothetical protein [Victivallales bacterium]